MSETKAERAARSAAYRAWRAERPSDPAALDAWRARRPPYAGHDRHRVREQAPKPADLLARDDARREQQHDKSQVRALLDELRVERARTQYITGAARAAQAPRLLDFKHARGPKRPMSFVALLSDAHVEETVVAEQVNGLNSYSLSVAHKRLQRFFRAIADLVEHHRASGRVDVRQGVLWLGGDLMTGYIHEELVESNGASPTETVLWLLPRIRDGIDYLLAELRLERLAVPCSYGNHGRTTERTRIGTGAANSYEWMLYRLLAEHYARDARLSFDTNPSPHQFVEAEGKLLHFHHGDSVGYQGGVGGITIPLNKAVAAWNDERRADVHHVGHFHQLTWTRHLVANGSVIGYGPYSRWIKATFEPPQQAFYLLDRERGRCHQTALWVGKTAKPEAA